MQAFKTKELSKKSVNNAVVAKTVQRPMVVYPIAATVLIGAFASLFGISKVIATAIITGAAIATFSWAWEFFLRGNKHAKNFVNTYRSRLNERRAQTLKILKAELEDMNFSEAEKQLVLFKEKYTNFVSVLNKKFDPNELTYNRYISIAEQVYLGGLDNLENAALARKSVSAIDLDYIEKELQSLNKINTHNDAKFEELQKRKQLRNDQFKMAENLIVENEKALTQLDLVSTKISSISTTQGHAQIDFDDAMNELRHLIKRAETYSNSFK